MSVNYSKIHFYPCSVAEPTRGLELLLVEGESAARAVSSACDGSFQAVLAMQGKPMNAAKASKNALANYPLFRALKHCLFCGSVETLVTPSQRTANSKSAAAVNSPCLSDRLEPIEQEALEQLYFDRVVLLFDPDADGIHCGALMMIYFLNQWPGLLASGAISIVHAPCARVSWLVGESMHSRLEFTPESARNRATAVRSDPRSQEVQCLFYRGLASLDREELQASCLCPDTRRIHALSTADAEAALRVFGGSRRT